MEDTSTSDEEIYRSYLDGMEGFVPAKDAPLLLRAAYAMGGIGRARQDICCLAGVAKAARLLLTEPAAEDGAPPAPRRGGRPAKPAQPPKKKPHPMTSAVRRLAGTKPVACPVRDCESPGIRSKMNFCTEHAGALPKADRQRLRQMQRAGAAAAPVE